MSTYPPPGYGPGESSHDPRHPGQSGGYGGPTGGGSGYPPPSANPYSQSSGSYPQDSGSYPQDSGSYPPPTSGSYPPPSAAGPYSQSSDPYGASSGYPAPGGPSSAPSSPAGSGAEFGTPVPPKKSKAPLIVGVVLGVLLLCCGGGAAAFFWAGDDEPGNVAGSEQTPTPEASTKTTPPKGKPSPTQGEDTVEGNLDKFKKGDCLTIDEQTSEVEEVSCGTKGALKVLLRKNGTTKESACEDTDYTQYIYQDGTLGTLEDFILCVAPAR